MSALQEKSKPVAVIGTTDAAHGVKKSLDLIGAGDILRRYDRFLIKPNYVNDSMPSTGVTTDPKIIIAVLDYLLGAGIKIDRIAVGEGGMASFDTMLTFKKVGLLDALKGYDVKLFDLNKEPHVDVTINGRSLKKVGIAKPFLDYDCIISVPKLKIHCWALTTLSMKNMMGGILPKGIMHDDLHQKLVDLNKAFGPELSVIDGIRGCQRHELACDPIDSNVIVAGEDFVAVDSVGSYLMGLCPDDVTYLALAKKAGLGENGMERIDIRGDRVSKLRKYFKM